MALGATGVIVLPLTGDDVLTALGSVRARRAEQAQVRDAMLRADTFRLERTLFARVAELARMLGGAESTARKHAAELLDAG